MAPGTQTPSPPLSLKPQETDTQKQKKILGGGRRESNYNPKILKKQTLMKHTKCLSKVRLSQLKRFPEVCTELCTHLRGTVRGHNILHY